MPAAPWSRTRTDLLSLREQSPVARRCRRAEPRPDVAELFNTPPRLAWPYCTGPTCYTNTLTRSNAPASEEGSAMKAWALATLGLSVLLLGAAPPETESPSRIAALIEQLGADSFSRREAASKALADIGVPAVRFLRKAAVSSKNPEIRSRAERVLQTIGARVPGLVQKGEEIYRIAWGGIHSYNTTFSADGRYFLAGGDGSTLRLYEVKSGKLLHELTGHTHWAQHAVFLPDGKQALSASMDGTLRLWNLTTGKEVRKLDGHPGGAYSVDVSHDGKWAVSAGADRTLRLWDVRKGREVQILEGHTDGCMALFTADGKQILSSGADR